MKEGQYFCEYDKIISNLSNNGGAFLTVQDNSNRLNVMTIGWSLSGIMWNTSVFMVAVKSNRYTFQLIENADDFTVTFPFSSMEGQLAFCGTHSGKDIDKFKKCNLVALAAQKTKSPVIEAKEARCYECKIIQSTAMDKSRLVIGYDKKLYQDKSYHTFYFGEIISCYEIQ